MLYIRFLKLHSKDEAFFFTLNVEFDESLMLLLFTFTLSYEKLVQNL